MARLINLMVTFLCVGMFVFAGAVGLKTGNQSSFQGRVGQSQGTVKIFDAGLLIVEFTEPVINSCGDTQVYGFITAPNGLSLQMKPVFIPEAKADSVNNNTLVFPMWDVMVLLTEPGDYNIEFFVDNNCSLLHNKTVSLPPITLELTAGGINV